MGKKMNTLTITSGWGSWVLLCRVTSPKIGRNSWVYLYYEHTGLEGLVNHHPYLYHYRHNYHHTGLEELDIQFGHLRFMTTNSSVWCSWLLVGIQTSSKTTDFLVYLYYELTGLECLVHLHHHHHHHYVNISPYSATRTGEPQGKQQQNTDKDLGVGLVGLCLPRDLPQDFWASFGLLVQRTHFWV